MFKSALLFAILIMMSNPLFAASDSRSGLLDQFLKSVKRTTLSNGVTLITKEQKGSGVVAINTWVKAGYFNEPDEVAGMAHLFEHMFFKGSKMFPGAEQISQELALVGGQSNAGTIYDSTNYYFVVPTQGFRRAMEIQADALIEPMFNPQELKKEAEVVIEESNRKYDNPPAVSLERMYATAYTQHRMKRWRIGSNEVLRNIQRDQLLAFFETLYRPENMVLTIAGDISHPEAIQIAKETFGKLPRGKLNKQRGPKEPPQEEFRYGRSVADIQQGYSVFGWHTAGVGEKDEIALNVLAAILGQGRSSRLYVNVVKPDGASTIEANHETFDDVGIFEVQASFDEANRATADRLTLAEIERMKSYGPTPYELQLAKNKLESTFIFGIQDVLGQAQTLSYFEANYGFEAMKTRTDRLKALTGAEVQDVARRYLTLENMTLYHYAPRNAAAMTADEALSFVKEALAAKTSEPAQAELPKSAAAVASATSDAPVMQETLFNGATLIVQPRSGSGTITAGVYFRGGRFDENTANAGITQLLTRAMRKGTSSKSGLEIDRQIEFLGTELNLDVQDDFFGINLSILASNFVPGFELLSDVLLNPTFPADGIEEERAQQVAALKRSMDSSLQRPFQLASEALYASHPYGLPPFGYQTSLSQITSNSLREWWQGHVVAEDTVILIAGDISANEAKQLSEKLFSKLPKRSKERSRDSAVRIANSRMEIVEYRDRKQSAIVLMFPTVVRTDPDWPVLRLLGNVTSGLAGTFFAELRGKQALAYTVFARDSSRVQHGTFVAYMATEASKEPQAREALLHEIRRLSTDGITEGDVKRAKSSFEGATRIGLQTNSAVLSNLAGHYFFGVGLDFTEKLLKITSGITLEQLREASKKYLSGDIFVTGVQRGKSS